MTTIEPLVLGIETSCDETGVGVVHGRTLLADAVASSVDEHARFGGVVPEVASRAHLEAIVPTMRRALDEAKVTLADIDAFAVTSGPGLAIVDQQESWVQNIAVRRDAQKRGVGRALLEALLAEAAAKRVGRILLEVAVDNERAQRRGLGRSLLHVLLAEAARLGVPKVLLEVAVDNVAAQKLYAEYGFEPVGVRKGYYQPSNTDALVMRRDDN